MFASKQGQPQPHVHSKALDTKSTTVKWPIIKRLHHHETQFSLEVVTQKVPQKMLQILHHCNHMYTLWLPSKRWGVWLGTKKCIQKWLVCKYLKYLQTRRFFDSKNQLKVRSNLECLKDMN